MKTWRLEVRNRRKWWLVALGYTKGGCKSHRTKSHQMVKNFMEVDYMYVNRKKFYSKEIAIEWAAKNGITEYWFEYKESFVRLVWRQEEV